MIRVEDVPIIKEGTLIRCVSRGRCFLFQYRERDYDTRTCIAIEGSVIRVTEGRAVVVNFEHIFPMGRCSVLDEIDHSYLEIYNNAKTV